jgi:hypothetical protein
MSNTSDRMEFPPRARNHNYHFEAIYNEHETIDFCVSISAEPEIETQKSGMFDFEKNYLRNTSSASDLVSKEGESLLAAEDIYCFACRRKVAKVDGRYVGGKEPWYGLPVNYEPCNAWTCSLECHEKYNHAKHVMNKK